MSRILLFVIFLMPCVTIAQLSIPPHGGVWVHDESRLLSAGMKSELEAILKAERDSTSNQIAVLVIPSLEGESLEDFSIRVVEDWKIGKKGKDNGVLFLVAVKEHKIRIEVGLGLEGVLTDAMSNRIIRNNITPYFKQGDYDGGVRAGVMAIIHTIRGEYVNTDPPQRKRSRSPLSTIIFFVIIVLVALARRRRGGGGGMGAMWVAGSILSSGLGRSSGSWGSGSDFGGGGGFGGGGSSGSW